MATGPEHYREAERHLREAFACTEEQNYLSDWNQRQAQVHATLAQAAAFVFPFLVTGEDTAESIEAWRQAVTP